jgi:hypothetical protein
MPLVSGDQRITGLDRVRSGREVRWNGCRSKGFPEPIGAIAAGRIWRRADVEAWARDTGRLT